MIPCPAPKQLHLLLADKVNGPEAEILEGHVENCPICQQTLEALTAGAAQGGQLSSVADVPGATRVGTGNAFLRRLERGPPVRAWMPATVAGTELAPVVASAPPIVPGYEVLNELGRGAMGVVYKAWQINLSRIVVLKTLQARAWSNPDEQARMRIEASEAAARLEHPHIVRIYEIGEVGGQPYLALEYVDGGSLEQKLRGVPQPPAASASLLEQVARAMHHAHEHGVIHRDLKPSNILLNAAGAPKVSDFGLAKLTSGSGATLSGMIMGTASYMAPEQARGNARAVGAPADVYALGSLLYEMLTGRPPFRGESVHDTLQQVLSEEPVPPHRLQPSVSRDLETICLHCLRKEPERRYASAAELANDLKRFLDGAPIRARPVGVLERGLKWARRRPAVAVLSLAVLVVSLFGFALVTWQWGRARDERHNAIERAEAEAAAHHRAQRLAALLALDRGITLCETGQADRGLLWLVHGLRLAPADAEDIRQACRANLGAWAGHVYPLAIYRTQPGRGQRAAFRPDGKAVLTGGLHGNSELWDPASGELIARVDHDEPLEAVAFSPNNKRMALAVGEHVEMRETQRGRRLRILEGHKGKVRAVAFSPDSRTVLTGSEDGTARLWDAASGKPHGAALVHTRPVIAVAFRPGSAAEVATGCEDGKARFWNLVTGKRRGVLLKHADRVTALVFHRDGGVLLTGCWDGTAQRWDAATGARIGQPLRHASKVVAVDFSPDGATLLTGSYDHTAQLWDARTGEPIGAPLLHQFGVMSAVFSPDGKSVLTGCWGDSARLWRVPPRPGLRLVLAHPKTVYSVAFSPDGKTVATGSVDRRFRIWDAVTGKNRGEFLAAAGTVHSLAFSPDGKILATACTQQPSRARRRPAASQIQLWQIQTYRQDGPPLTHASGVRALAFGADSKTLLAGSRSGPISLWDLAARRFRPLPVHGKEVRSITLAPDGTTVLTGSVDFTARLWDLRAGKTLAVLEHQDVVAAVAFSPDGKTLLTGSYTGSAQLWDARTHERWGKPMEHRSYVHAVAFSPDGRTILTGSEDQTARLWDAATCRPIGPPLPQGAAVRAAVFHPDGRSIATAGGTATYLWPVLSPVEGDSDQIRLWAEVRTGLELGAEEDVRLLSPAEWQQRRSQLAGAK